MNEKTGRVFNTTLVRDWVCAQCWKPLVEKFVDDGWVVSCPRQCQPGGFVTARYATGRWAQEMEEFYEVASYYPEFDPRPRLSLSERKRLKAEIFGEL